MSQNASQALGTIGEELAYQFLLRKGYKVLIRNYACALGEIDLIAKENGSLVFIEVKTRSSPERGMPAESVTFRKQNQLTNTALYYLKRYGIADVPCRFDVVAVLLRNGEEPLLELIQDAFFASR